MKVINKDIDMIAWFKQDGQLIPLKFRLIEADENIVVKINKIVVKDILKVAGKTVHNFRCQSLIHGIETIYELRYCTNDFKWTLFKI